MTRFAIFKIGAAFVLTVAVLGPPAVRAQDAVGESPSAWKLPIRSPFKRGMAPPETHRFWAAKNWFPTNLTASGVPYTMFAEPLALETTPAGLLVGYAPSLVVEPDFFVHPVQPDLTIGTRDLHAKQVTISDESDWTVDFDFGTMTSRVGRGMPFVYITTQETDPTITFVSTPQIFYRSDVTLGVTIGGNHYGLFCPAGSTWTDRGQLLICHLPKGKRYFSVALLPDVGSLALFARYAFSFPESTSVHWNYDETTGNVRTTYTVTTQAKQGKEAGFLQALYPHQYASLSGDSVNTPYGYTSARGVMKLFNGASFDTVDVFHGVLPFLPPSPNPGDERTTRELLADLVDQGTAHVVRDIYGEGKYLDRMAEVLPLADRIRDPASLNRLRNEIEKEFDFWLEGDVKNHVPGFAYDKAWGTVVGYPASFGSDDQLNDHHFQYGYWIHAAALLGLYDPSWFDRATGGRKLDWLIRDIANIDRTDSRFPFLRHFDVYAGHSWASGQAPFGDGENEESSSEAANAWAGMILYASEAGDKQLRDAAVWMYTLETNAAYDYWFNDGPVRTFPENFRSEQIANLFDGKSDTATWFGNAPGFEHGIEFLPFTGASLYLGRDPAYCRINLAEATRQTGGRVDSTSEEWPDILEMYEALFEPQAALREWQKTRFTFDGETRVHEFAWIRSLSSLGSVDQSITADTTLYAAFRLNGVTKHVAFNLSSRPNKVTFSDGFKVVVPSRSYAIEERTVRIGL